MVAAASEYFDWCDENPLIAQELKTVSVYQGGSYNQLEDVPYKRVYTMEGLCRWLHCNTVYFYQFEAGLAKSTTLTKKQINDFSQAIRDIKEVIRIQKYEGAAAGFFKEGLITRDLGITDKIETVNYNSIALSKEEMKRIADELDKDV